MTPTRTRCPRGRPTAVRRFPAVLGTIVCGAAWAAAACAEDDRAVDEVTPLAAQTNENWVDLGANFDSNVFQDQAGNFQLQHGRRGPGRRRGDVQQPPPEAAVGESPECPTLDHLRKLAEARLGRIEAACKLSDSQRRKLRLAMESDMRRLAAEIDLERQKYQGLEVNFSDQAGQRQWQQFQRDVQECRRRLQELFGVDSLFAKVLPTTLDDDQYARFTAETDAHLTTLWTSLVAAALVKWDDVMGLDQKQHAALERLLLEKRPPLRFEGFANRAQNNQHIQQMLVWVALADIDPRQLRAELSERQAALVSQYAAQGKAMQSHVEAQGFLEKVSR